ncbi:hypothetical protein SDRG_04689 [Saprolegnia diclina VS20]|uniref:Uncharacterized protein n=1 Tax=Saprolegnia diclina (strain VS20) TaxID=1156394 RepID=T0QJP0_SAPDV|nr:hypothetical protein SDRG_04689 [Saprolegnia diclina VS20]EQC38264.1 hypothetical protein SDRG_04689 [Saprolegnia diclina VS20]|eukprot:XP_008608591.1 hypothetical protein SDRG_04689 [Saprolegnia diclina VS20]
MRTKPSPLATGPTFSPKQIALFYFAKLGEGSVVDTKTGLTKITERYQCLHCPSPHIVTIQRNAGYNNLAQHVYSQHKDYATLMTSLPPPPTAAMDRPSSTSLRSKASLGATVHNYLDWIVGAHLPMDFAEMAGAHMYIKLDRIEPKKLRKYLRLVTRRVQADVRAALPPTFALVVERCVSETGAPFLGLFAAYALKNELQMPLLALYHDTTPNEAGCEVEYAAFLDYVLADLKRTRADILCMIASVESPFRTIADDMDVPMVTCASSRLDAAILAFLATPAKADAINAVRDLMNELQRLRTGIRYRSMRELYPILEDDAKTWPSTLAMLQRFFKLRPLLAASGTYAHLLDAVTAHDETVLRSLLEHLVNLNSVANHLLQTERTSLSDVRQLLDSLLLDYSSLSPFLNADGVESPAFEKAVVKLQQGVKLQATDRAALRDFESPVATALAGLETDYATRLLKRARLEADDKYLEILKVLPATANRIQHAFATAKNGVLPTNIETLLFLQLNRSVWPVDVVADVVANAHLEADIAADESSDEDDESNHFV